MTIQIRNIYQGEKLNVDQEKATGTHGVIIKGGQGEYQDYLIHNCNYIDECERVDLPWGISWQMDARYSPEKHKAALKAFCDRKGDHQGFGRLGLWLACELPFYPMPEKLYKFFPFAYYKPIESVWRGMYDFTGEYPGVYISISKWNLIFGKCPLALQQEFACKSKLWAAQYKTDMPDVIGQWSEWWLWQYQENPDYSIFKGDDQSFRKFYDLSEEDDASANNDDQQGDSADNSPIVPPIVDRHAILDEAIKAIEALK